MGRAGETINHLGLPFTVDQSRHYHIEFKEEDPGPQPETPKVGVIDARSLKYWGTDELQSFLLQVEEERQKANPTEPPQTETEKNGGESNLREKKPQNKLNSQTWFKWSK